MSFLNSILFDGMINSLFTLVIFSIFMISSFGIFIVNKKRSFLISMYVPGILTSIGIFGTFLGICIGLYNFDPTEIKISTPILIQGLRTAFITSVLGLLASMIFRFIDLLKNITLSKGNTSTNVNENIEDISKALINLNQGIAYSVQIQNEFLNEMKDARKDNNDSNNRLYISLNDFLRNSAENNSKALIEALEDVMRDFNAKINEQFGDNFKQLNQAVEKLVDWQNNYILQIEKSDVALAKSVDVFNESAALFKISSNALESANTLSVSVDRVISENLKSIQALSTMIVEVDKIGQSANKVIPSINENLNSITKEFGEQVQTTVRKTTEFVDMQNNQYQKAFESLRDNVKLNQTQMDEFIKNATENALKSMNKISMDQEENIKRQLAALDEALGEELSKALEMLGTNLSALSNQFVDDYRPLTERLKEVVRLASHIKEAS